MIAKDLVRPAAPDPSRSWNSWPGAVPGSHIRLCRLILLAFRALSSAVVPLWAFTSLIAGVKVHNNRRCYSSDAWCRQSRRKPGRLFSRRLL